MTGKVAPQLGISPADSSNRERERLEGWIPGLATPDEIRSALDKAFDYRGDVTVTLRDGKKIEGYIFDRRSQGAGLEQCQVRMLPKEGNRKISIRYSEIARLEFSGRDTAAGRRFELWVRQYHERKARGEKNISLEPEPLEDSR